MTEMSDESNSTTDLGQLDALETDLNRLKELLKLLMVEMYHKGLVDPPLFSALITRGSLKSGKPSKRAMHDWMGCLLRWRDTSPWVSGS